MPSPFPGMDPYIESQSWEEFHIEFLVGVVHALIPLVRPRYLVKPLRDHLPTAPIPLAGDDADVPLDLQEVFTSAFDQGGYDYSLNYEAPVQPPLQCEADAEWVQRVIGQRADKGE